jgi:hypothetical protein
MEQYNGTFDNSETSPSLKEIEKRLRKLGCTNEQVIRHLDQLTKSRTQPPKKEHSKNRSHQIDWP